MPTITKKQSKTMVDAVLSKPYRLMLHNDDYNSFEWVIECLVKVCKHEPDQATQCAHIVHNNGKCDVKYGDLETISEMTNKLKSAGLSATMEVNE
jgi:ATP-dependent Clp protease adaptor protein ClpS